MEAVLPRAAEAVRDALAVPRGRARAQCPEALRCVGVLAAALHAPWRPYAAQLIEPMILTGLSPTLVESLQARFCVPDTAVANHTPSRRCYSACLLCAACNWSHSIARYYLLPHSALVKAALLGGPRTPQHLLQHLVRAVLTSWQMLVLEMG